MFGDVCDGEYNTHKRTNVPISDYWSLVSWIAKIFHGFIITLLTCLAKGKAETLARVYIDSDPTHSEADKRRISIQTVARDQEPRQFRAAFPSWQEGMWGVNFNSFG